MHKKQLEIFKTLAETLNFTRTAEQMSLSQTTVTLQIHNLEEELDLKLFDRTSRTVRLTPAGRVFYESVKNLLDLLEMAVSNAQIVAQGYTGMLEIGFVNEANATGISGMIREYLKEHPSTRPKFYGEPPAKLLDMLLADKCDVIFTPSFDKLRAQNLCNYKISHYRLIAAFSKEHRFSKMKALKFSDFAGENLIYVSNTAAELDFSYAFVRRLESDNIHFNIIERTDNIDSVFFMVDTKLGVTVIPEYFAERFHENTNIRTCIIDEELKETDFLATWKEGRLSPELESFVAFLKTFYPENGK